MRNPIGVRKRAEHDQLDARHGRRTEFLLAPEGSARVRRSVAFRMRPLAVIISFRFLTNRFLCWRIFTTRRSEKNGKILRPLRKLRHGPGTRSSDERKSFVPERPLPVQSSGLGDVGGPVRKGGRLRMQTHRRRVEKY